MWSLWPQMASAFNEWAIDYFENILVPLDNYISKGTEVFLTSKDPDYLASANQARADGQIWLEGTWMFRFGQACQMGLALCVQECTTGTRVVRMAAIQGPGILFCMSHRTNCILLVFQ
jgi:hypothetical protein